MLFLLFLSFLLLLRLFSLAVPVKTKIISWVIQLLFSQSVRQFEQLCENKDNLIMRSILRDQHLLGNVAYRACCALVLINLIVRFTFFLFSFFASLSLLLGAWLLPYLRLQCFLRSHFGSGSLRQSRCRGCHRRYRAVRFLSLVICKISRFNLFKIEAFEYI